MQNAAPLERTAILAILPVVAATAARTSLYVLPSLFQCAEVKTLVGDASATGTITIIKASDTNGSNSVAVATAAYGGTGTVGDNQVIRMSIMPADMCDELRPYFAVSLGAGVALAGAIIEGFDPRESPPVSIAGVINAR